MKIVVSLMLMVPIVANAYSIKDLESAIKESDVGKTRLLVKKVEISREDRLRLIDLARETIKYRKNNCKLNHLNRPFWHKSLPEIAADLGSKVVPVIGAMLGAGILFLYSKLPEELINRAKIQNLFWLRDFANSEEVLNKYLSTQDNKKFLWVVYEEGTAHNLYNLRANQLNIYSGYTRRLQNLALYKKKLLIGCAIAVIAAGPILWLVKRSLAKKQADELNTLYETSIEIKQLLFTTQVK